jgi:hypothetical protein
MKLDAVRTHALALPEVTEAPHFNYGSFRVRGKIFVTIPPEGTHVHVFVPDEHRDPAVAAHPEFIEKLWWGKKVVGLRLTLAKASPTVVKRLVQLAWSGEGAQGVACRHEGNLENVGSVTGRAGSPRRGRPGSAHGCRSSSCSRPCGRGAPGRCGCRSRDT